MKNNFLLLFFSLTVFVAYANGGKDTFFPNGKQLNIKESQKETILGDLNNTDEYLDFLHTYHEGITSEIILWDEIAAENELLNKHTQEVNIHMYNYALVLRDIERDNIRAAFWIIKSNVEESDSVYQKIVKPYQNLINMTLTEELPKTISELNGLAKIGSKEAAKELYKYYRKNKDETLALYWLRIGAQNGDIECVNDYINILKQCSNEYDKLRSKFWESCFF